MSFLLHLLQVSHLKSRVVFSAAGIAFLLVAGCTSQPGGGAREQAFLLDISADPTTLNPITSSDAYSSMIQTKVHDSLCVRDDDTYEWLPALAESWNVSADGKTFTFKIREGVKWSDGQPLTAEDVKYSFDVYFEKDRFNAPHMMVYLENIQDATVIDPLTVRFRTKTLYFKNFDVIAGGLTIIPKHYYSQGDVKDPKFNLTLVGTGPYILDEWSKGRRIVLKKNPNYWGDAVPYFKERANFDRILYRIVKEEAVSLELFKKGDLDYTGLTPEQYTAQAKGGDWGKRLIAVKGENSASTNYNYGFIAWNQLNPLFKDRDVRVALSHLINRDHMIEKFLFGMREKAVGPFGNRSSATNPKVKAIDYNPEQALALLKKAGWSIGPNGLSKKINGKDTLFEFTLLGANPDFEKYLTIIKEDMKKVGITMNIRVVEWNSFIKLLDERKYDAVTLAWSVNSLEPDPKQIWHSSAIAPPGHNFVSYSDKELDRLIDQVRVTMDAKKRIPIYHRIHEIIARDQPYSFFFNQKNYLYAVNARIQRKQDSFKYAIGTETWSLTK